MPFQGGLGLAARGALITPAGGIVVSAGKLGRFISLQPTVEATPDYSDTDVVGGLQVLTNAARVPGGTGKIVSISILSKVDIAVAARLLFFMANPTATTFTENGNLSINAADIDKMFRSVEIAAADFADTGTPEIFSRELNIGFQCAPGSKDLYVVFQAGGTINLGSASDLTFNYSIEQD